MSETSKLTTFQAILFILIVMVNKIILNYPKEIILSSGSGSILNLIFIGFMILLFCTVLSKLFSKFPGMDIIDISKYLGGNILKIIVSIIFILFFILAIMLVNINFSSMLKTIYFKTSPTIFIYSFFLIAIIIANKLGFKSIVKTNTIIIPFTILSILFIILGTAHEFKITGIFPILGNNIKQTFLYGSTNIFAFSGISYLYLIQPMLKNNLKFKKISILSIGISWIFLFLSVLSLLLIYPIEAYNIESNSLYAITRLVQYGAFLQRTDALFILLWILSTLSYLSIELFFIIHITKKVINIENEKILVYPYAAIILLLCSISSNELIIEFIEKIIFKYGTILVNYGLCFIILLVACIKKHLKGEKI